MRRVTDIVYRLCTLVAGVLLVTILALVVAQIASRLMLVVVPGLDEFAAYCLAGATFFALAPTLRAGVHIRVMLLTQRLPPAWSCGAEILCYGIGLALSAYLAYASIDFALSSYMLREVAHGMVAVPLWIPRLTMPIGTTVLCLAFLEGLVEAVAAHPRRAPAQPSPAEIPLASGDK